MKDKDECVTLTEFFLKQAEKDGLLFKFMLQISISKEYFDLSRLIVWTNYKARFFGLQNTIFNISGSS